MIEVRPLGLDGVVEILPKKHADERGFFSETHSRRAFAEAGVDIDFVQDNHSLSRQAGVLRGLHYQLPPFAQAKLVRVVRGAIFDVVVDIRRGSPSFGRWVGIEVSAARWNQIMVPTGFAHGFQTLEPDTEVVYKVSQYYSASHDRGIRWNDPAIGVAWPEAISRVLSAKDEAAPLLAEAELFDFN
jgi:dTDP-4-dehydrorhamnose 3,5-epimerase